jgi:hypothetical protein
MPVGVELLVSLGALRALMFCRELREFEAAMAAAPTNQPVQYRLVYLDQKLGMDQEAAKHVQPAGHPMENT